jgi:hypothetical protein
MENGIRPEDLKEYRLIRIKYDHTYKEYVSFISKLDPAEFDFIKIMDEKCPNETINKRTSVSDWIWCTSMDMERFIGIIEKYSIRYKITDHTEEYYKRPEKISTLREKVDEWISDRIDVDFVLDRISHVGMDGITKIEKNLLEKKSRSI